jgi:hypothetical protein
VASDDKKIKTDPNPKDNAPPKDKSAPDPAPSKAESGDKEADKSSGYNRGEGQKPVSQACRDNWNLIFAKKKSDNIDAGAFDYLRQAAKKRSTRLPRDGKGGASTSSAARSTLGSKRNDAYEAERLLRRP